MGLLIDEAFETGKIANMRLVLDDDAPQLGHGVDLSQKAFRRDVADSTAIEQEIAGYRLPKARDEHVPNTPGWYRAPQRTISPLAEIIECHRYGINVE